MAYQIRVNCTCGKLLKIPEKYAGKRGRCPNCGKKIAIPTMQEIQNKVTAPKEDPEMRNCPTCGAFLNSGDEVCVSCRMNVKTGEWDMEGQERVGAPGKLSYIGVVVVCALLIAGGIFIISRLNNNGKQSLSTWPENAAAANSQKEKMSKTPKVQPPVTEEQKEDKSEREKKATEAYQAVLQLKNKPDKTLLRWVKFSKIYDQYRDTGYMQKRLEDENPLTEAVAYIKKEREELDKIYQAKDYQKVLMQGTEKLETIARQSYAEEELQEELAKYVVVCRQAAAELKPVHDHAEQEEPASEKERELRNLKSQLARFRKDQDRWLSFYAYFRKRSKNWEFSNLAREITAITYKAKELQSDFGDDPDIVKVIKWQKRSEILNKFWGQVVETIAQWKNQKVTLILKDNTAQVGTLVKLEKEKIYLKPEPNKKSKSPELQTFGLNELSARGIGTLMLRDKTKRNKDLYVALSHFYYVNEDATQCRDYSEEALEKGAQSYEVADCQEWALRELKEQVSRQEEIDKINKEKQNEKELLAEEKKLDGIRNDAWRLIKEKLLPAYKNDQTKKIFQYLDELRRTVPRDELIKINKDVRDKEGKSLYDMADDAMSFCTKCRGAGTNKCPDCKGEGSIVLNDIQIKSKRIVRQSKYCYRCAGKGEIYCPTCYHKRHNRKYNLILDFYDEID